MSDTAKFFVELTAGLIVVGVVLAWSRRVKVRRLGEVTEVVQDTGFTPTPDRDDLVGSFRLTGAPGTRLIDAVQGRHDGRQVACGTLVVVDGNAPARFASSAIVDIGSLPNCRIWPRAGLPEALNGVDGTPVMFESEEFNKRFAVTADEPLFATALVDQRMMSWLLNRPDGVFFEAGAGGVLAGSTPVEPAAYPSLIEDVTAFADQLPRSLTPWFGMTTDTQTQDASSATSRSVSRKRDLSMTIWIVPLAIGIVLLAAEIGPTPLGFALAGVGFAGFLLARRRTQR